MGNPRQQRVTGIGGHDPAGPFLAIKGYRVSRQLLAPECRLEALPQLLRGQFEAPRQGIVPERPSQPRGVPLGGVDIALHFAERDGPLCQLAIRVEDRVGGVLPALIDQPRRRLPVIFNKPIPIGIAVTVDPAQRRRYVRPYPSNCLEIAGAREILPGEHYEQRRRIDTAVVPAERYLA